MSFENGLVSAWYCQILALSSAFAVGRSSHKFSRQHSEFTWENAVLRRKRRRRRRSQSRRAKTRSGRRRALSTRPLARTSTSQRRSSASASRRAWPEPLTKKRKVSLGSLLAGKVKKEVATPQAPELDELEQYLADPEEPDIEVDVLAWWKAKETTWPALAKMVKQYFAAPASSAGVERVFSAAGKMNGDLQKSAKDSTLEHSLFTAFNTE